MFRRQRLDFREFIVIQFVGISLLLTPVIKRFAYLSWFVDLSTSGTLEQWNTVTKVSTEVTALQSLLSNSVNLISRTISDIEFLAGLLLEEFEQLVSRGSITSNTDDLVLCDVGVFQDGSDVFTDILTVGDGDAFLSGSGDGGGAVCDVDSGRGIRQSTIEEETGGDEGVGDLACGSEFFEVGSGITLSLEDQFTGAIVRSIQIEETYR